MPAFRIGVPAETFETPSQTPIEIVRTGLYCEICREDWHEPYAHRDADGSWHVPAKDGGFYLVAQDTGGNWHCDCAGFEYRGRCRHLYGKEFQQGVISLEMRGAKHDLPQVTWLSYEQHRWPPDITLEEL